MKGKNALSLQLARYFIVSEIQLRPRLVCVVFKLYIKIDDLVEEETKKRREEKLLNLTDEI